MLDNINSPKDLKNIPQNELKNLCAEIRQKIIKVMSKNGGHLASNLGAVEITTAIHYVFDAPEDILIFDVGHQSYTHKILTGRNKEFESIRLGNGISGFPRRKESIYDPVDSGHCSTSISSAVGFAVAGKLENKNNHVIALIGDGALTGGESFEGLNYVGHLDIPVLVILNDNEMSISKNVGGIYKKIGRVVVSKPYQKLTALYYNIMRSRKGLLKAMFWFAKKVERGMKIFLGLDNIFLNLGFEYIGPVDGHDIDYLIFLLRRIKNNVRRPVLLHIKTTKGKGYKLAEGDPTTFHGVTPYLMQKGIVETKEDKTFTEFFSKIIVELGEKHKNIVAITAAMGEGTGLNAFRDKFPERIFDVGIAEQHAATFSGALGFAGLKPVFAVYSTFMQRAIDQIIQDVCISGSPVIFAVDRAGIVGADGETHQGQFDISFVRMLPNITLMAPCDGNEMKLMFEYAYTLKTPSVIRYPRDIAGKTALDNNHPSIEENPFVILKEGTETLVIVIGPFVDTAKKALEETEDADGLIYLRILKPFPDEKIISEMKKYKNILVIEENVYNGSVSEYIGAFIAKNCLKSGFDSINIPDMFIEHDSRKNIMQKLGFTKENIIEKMNNFSKNYTTV